MSDAVLFAFIEPAMQIIAVCAAAFIALFFLLTLSDALRARVSVRRTPGHDDVLARPET